MMWKVLSFLQVLNDSNHLINNYKATTMDIAGYKYELGMVPAFKDLCLPGEIKHMHTSYT